MFNEQVRGCSRKWRVSGQHLVGDHSQAVNVRSLVESLSPALFGRHILRRPNHGTEAAQLLGGIVQSQGLIFRDRKSRMTPRGFANFRLRLKLIEREEVLQTGISEIQDLDVGAI